MEIRFEESEQEGTRAVVSRWLRAVGDRVERNDPLLEVETDKVTVEIVAPEAGTLEALLVAEGDELEPGQTVARVSQTDAAPAGVETSTRPTESTPSAAKAARPRLSPAVRKLLAQNDLHVDDIEGTGSKGRVTVRDVQRHLASMSKAPVSKTPVDPAPTPGVGRIPHSPMRQRIAEHMTRSLLHTAPHVTSVFEADLSRVIAHRKAHKADFERQGVNLTLSAYFVRATVAALTAVPMVNSRYHDEYLEVFPHHHIGVGTALGDEGLVVPVVRHAESLNLFGTAQRLDELVSRARAKKLSRDDLEGGTFSISNHGVSGSLVAAPIIINQPQSAILGLGKLEKRVVVREVDGEDVMAIRPMCYVTLTIDHRALDAHQTNQFLTAFVDALESWPAVVS